jgi:DNA-binding XRE family transcriptional regulator
MVAGTIRIKGERFVIVPESEYDKMQELTRELAEGNGPPLPKPDARGNVPAIEYGRASLARKLIRDRRRVGLTQADLARRAGIRAETVCRIEKGKSTPDLATFNKIHRVLEKAEKDLASEE